MEDAKADWGPFSASFQSSGDKRFSSKGKVTSKPAFNPRRCLTSRAIVSVIEIKGNCLVLAQKGSSIRCPISSLVIRRKNRMI